MPGGGHDEGHDEVRRALLELAAEKSGRAPALGDRLTSLGVDSLALVDLIGVVEKRFDIKVDPDVMDVETLEELARYIAARRAPR